ncbi:MAG: hypothetical protein ACW99Q_04505, partial [Candidatus Kariarchaeaceae archaeon]
MHSRSKKSGYISGVTRLSRNSSIIGFVLIYFLVVLTSSGSVEAKLNFSDYRVTGNSNIDGINNIGSDGPSNLQNARTLDGNYQTLIEENVSEIAKIEDYVDRRSNIDTPPNSGNIASFENTKAADFEYSQLSESGRTQVWGDASIQGTETAVNWMRCMTGNFTLGSGYRVNEIYVSSSSTSGGSQARLSVYQGGTFSDPNGATLVWDAGTVTSRNGYTGVRGGSAILNNNEPVWICVKGNDGTFNVHFDNAHDASSKFQSGNGRYMTDSTAHSTDETLPFENTLNSTGGTYSSFWYSFYIVVEDTNSDPQLDQEVQFTNVIDYLPIEILAIRTGNFNGIEDINVTYWTGINWVSITNDLEPYTWNNYSVPLTSKTFTIKFGGSLTFSDSFADTWEIDSILLVVEGVGNEEISIQSDTSNIDSQPDGGSVDDFNSLSDKDGLFANFIETSRASTILFQRASGSSGTSHTIDIGEPGNHRLVAVFVGNETSGSSTSGVTIDGKTGIKIAEADNPNGLGNHQELWVLTETGLGGSNGSVIVNVMGVDSSYAIHVMVFYNVRDSTSPFDVQIEDDSVSMFEIQPNPINIPKNGLLLFGAGNGASGTYNDGDWDTQATGIDDGLLPEIEMIEANDGNNPTSAVLAEAYWISNIDEQVSRQFRARGSVQNNRGTGIIASFEPVTFQLDQEFQWNSVPYDQYSEDIAIFTGNLSSEKLHVDYWNGTGWDNLISNLLANSWNNVSVTEILSTDTFTIRIRDDVKILDNLQETWQIDVILLSYTSFNTNYRLEWEHQVDNLDVGLEEFELTIFGYSSNPNESFKIQLWNISSMSWLELLDIQIGT